MEGCWAWTPARMQRRIEFFNDISGDILEVGCGTGWLTASLSGNITVVEPDKASIDFTVARVPGIEAFQGTFESIADCMPEASFDAVVGVSVLHHLEDGWPDRVARMLRPGGRVRFSEPNLLNPQVWLERNFREFFPYVDDHERAFTKWQLRGLLKGFKDVVVEPFDFAHPWLIGLELQWLEKIPVIREFGGSLLVSARL